jgi:hypothetical protein
MRMRIAICSVKGTTIFARKLPTVRWPFLLLRKKELGEPTTRGRTKMDQLEVYAVWVSFFS